MKVVRDPVHGDIELTDAAVSLIDTREVQRLRGVKQLGTASLVYPGAVHTRFEHALGSYHLARRIVDRIVAAGARLADEEREAVPLAALLHDVTHIPFGHTFEDERRLFERHDVPARTLRFLSEGALARALTQTGLRPLVTEILAGESRARPLLADIVRGTVGADLLDYLARDAYFCGFRRSWDERLLRAFEEADGRLAIAVYRRGLPREDALSEVVQLLSLRQALCERVYYHHAKVAAGAAVSRAVELALELGLVLEDLFPLRDEGLFALLAERYAPRSPALATILTRLEERRLYKRAYVLTPAVGADEVGRLVATFHRDRAARAHAEREIAAETGVAPEDVIVYCPAAHMAAKEADIPVIVEEGGARRRVSLADLRLPEVDGIVSKHRALWRFYVFLAGERADRLGATSRAAARRFGHESEAVIAAAGSSSGTATAPATSPRSGE